MHGKEVGIKINKISYELTLKPGDGYMVTHSTIFPNLE